MTQQLEGWDDELNPDRMAQEWADFLARIGAEPREHALALNRQLFRSWDRARRSVARATMNDLFEAEKAGRSFRWDTDVDQWLIEP